MFRKFILIAAFMLAACGESNDLGLDSNELAAYDRAALTQLADEGEAAKAIEIIRAKEQLNLTKTDDYLVLADIYLKQLNGVAAQVAIEKARDSGALSSQTALTMGSAYMLQRRLHDAKEELRNVKLSGQDGFEALLVQADIAVQEGDVELGRKYYGIAAGMQPENYRVDLGLALLELSDKNLEASEAAASSAREKDNSKAMPDYILGAIARMRGNSEKAITLLERALEKQPTHIHALLELTAAYLDVGKLEQSEQALDKAVALAANYPVTQFYVAFIQAEKGQLEQAQEVLLRSGDLFSLYPAANRLYGLVTYRMQKYAVASKFLQQFLNRNPDDREVRLALAESLTKAGFPERSLDVLKPLLPDQVSDTDAQAAAGAANVALGNGKAASESFRKAIEFTSQEGDNARQVQASLMTAQAIAEYKAGNLDLAIELMNGLDDMGLMSVERLSSIANMQIEGERYVDALATANKLMQYEDGEAVAHNVKGAIYYRMGKMEDAVNALSKAIALKPDYQSALKNRGYAYSALGNYKAAKADLKVLVTKVDADGQLYAKLGHTHLMLSEFSEAKTALQTARKLLPTSAVVAANYGYALAQLGMFDEAIAETQAAHALASFDKKLKDELRETIAEFKIAKIRKEKMQQQ
ncbi:tetratricopeptide repeat protein [Kordiimonas aestuarii]|uniref:tetratricopeptide repeat protein n=1 Tax=Kordiimonas aestuarii TaxID=1005925 RepID=UPI0021CFF96D|nr:tetratricopeptide repeat protein [Kordiimonas aestuarii]